MSQNRNVAIDGYSASGKTTVAKMLASELCIQYLDTGAMYRAVAYLALKDGIDLDGGSALIAMLAHHTFEIVPDQHRIAGYRAVIDGLDTGDRLFAPDVAAAVSSVAALPAVRGELVARQRELAAKGTVVMAGRDIGTVVLPNASYKFFLTASVDERARRRQVEFRERGLEVPFDEVRAQLAERDHLDSTRAISPLRAAADAVTIDSTDLQPAEVVARMRAVMESARA